MWRWVLVIVEFAFEKRCWMNELDHRNFYSCLRSSKKGPKNCYSFHIASQIQIFVLPSLMALFIFKLRKNKNDTFTLSTYHMLSLWQYQVHPQTHHWLVHQECYQGHSAQHHHCLQKSTKNKGYHTNSQCEKGNIYKAVLWDKKQETLGVPKHDS